MVGTEFVLIIVASVAFGAWLRSIAAGVFCFIVAICSWNKWSRG